MKRIGRAFAALLIAVASSSAVLAQDPLPSWNDGAAKKAIVDFVKATTDAGKPEVRTVRASASPRSIRTARSGSSTRSIPR